MCKAELEVLAELYAAKAEIAYRYFQETGISRYNREQRNAEELANAFRAAANAVEEHKELIGMRGELCLLANRAQKADTEEKARAVLKELVSYARMMGMVREEEV